MITEEVTPSLHIDYKHSKIKQYHKLGVALRTETTINNSYDFGIGRGLHNLAALRQVGFAANRRLLDVQRTSPDPFVDTARLTEVTSPVIIDGDRKTSGLRFGDPRVHALLASLLHFRHQLEGSSYGCQAAHLSRLTRWPLLSLPRRHRRQRTRPSPTS